jgi:hypothetical protein
MNTEWISQKGAGLLAIVIGLGFMAIAYSNSRYRYFFVVVGALTLFHACKRLKKKDTPFEKREREIRRKTM